MSSGQQKTSISHPLQINEVMVSGLQGVIGMTLCPGRKGSSLEGGSWDRDLTIDIAAVRAWQPSIVVSLLEEHEFALLGIPEFREVTKGESYHWEVLAIPDGGVPDAGFALRWAEIGPTVRNALRRGERVLIHCRAGLGRTGMLAAALLVELGAESTDAIACIRAARRGTIETRAQERYVENRRHINAPLTRESRIAGMMMGAAIGDALGSAFEFVTAEAISKTLGEPFAWKYHAPIPGSLLSPREPGWPTDDTAMALSVAHVIAKSSAAAEPTAADFADAFLKDLDRNTGRFGKLFWDGAPGIATMGALRRLAAGADPATCGGVDDGGNGAAMRVHPVAVRRDRITALTCVEVQSKVTHGHPAAIEAARAVTALIYDALDGYEPELAVPAGISEPQFVDAWGRAHESLSRNPEALPVHLRDAKMSSWETVATAHAISYVFQSDPNRALAAAAASGEDTDTVASLVGAFVGARCGISALDDSWIAGLQNRLDVQRAIEALIAL